MMAGADYRSCDKCGCKTFYDSNLDYDFSDPERPHGLWSLGDWAVICIDCAKTHKCIIVPKERPDGETTT